MVEHNPTGGYRFIAAPGRPFSGGAVADPGFDMVHAVFERPMSLDRGLDAAARHLGEADRPPEAIAGFELRIPEPFAPEAFEEFNLGYVERLKSMGVVVNGLMPAARTNVAASVSGVSEPSVYAMSYTVLRDRGRPAFVMSGVTEEKPGDLVSMLDSMMQALSTRMAELGVSWEEATTIQLYGVDDVQGLLSDTVLRRLGAAAVHGIHWFPSRPPIAGLQLEIDVRSVGRELGVSWEEATTIQLYGVDDVQGLLSDTVLRRLGPAAEHGIHWFPSRPPIAGLQLEIDVRSVGRELVLPVS